jgi:DNA-binding transcriptional LysR family regulator
MQVDVAVEAARRAAQPARKTFAIGFQTGHEINRLPQAMHVLRDEVTNIEVKVSSDYSSDLAEALARGRLDVAFMRMEAGYDLGYHVVDREPLIVLMPSDHRLTPRHQARPRRGQHGDGDVPGRLHAGGSADARLCQEPATLVRGQPFPGRRRRRRSMWRWATASRTPHRFSNCFCRASTNWWGRTRSTDAANPTSVASRHAVP